MPDLLLQAMSAKHSGDIALAKQLLSQALIQDPYNEAAWMLLSEVVEDVKLRRNCLERVLAINPDNSAASTALAKLNTAPFSPVMRGERDKPLNPPQAERTPPFTPPFTWDDSQEQYLALGDLTYQEQPAEPLPEPPPATPPTFDWANDSDEPDKTIQKIFTAISNPELASQPLADSELSPQDESEIGEPASPTQAEGDEENKWLNELVGPEEAAPDAQSAPVVEDYQVSAEPQLGLHAFTTPESPMEPVTSDYLLWDNPKAKADRLVILSNKSLIYANPEPSDIPHILGLFAEKKMLRDLLGENAGMIRLETIKRLTANPKNSKLAIEYLNNDKLYTHQLIFSSPQVRDEVITAFQLRRGANSTETTSSYKLQDKILSPIVVLVLLAFFGWGLAGGLPMLASLPEAQLGGLHNVVAALQGAISSIGVIYFLLILAALAVLTVTWMVSNLRKPSDLITIEYRQVSS